MKAAFNLPESWDQPFILYDITEGIFRKNFLIRSRDAQPMTWTGNLGDESVPQIYHSHVSPMTSQGVVLLPRVLNDKKGSPFYLGSILQRASDKSPFVVVRSLFSYYLWSLKQKELVNLDRVAVSGGKLYFFSVIGHLFDEDYIIHYSPEKWPGIS